MTIKTLHPDEEITFIKIRSSMYEIMIAPDKEFSLIVLQDDPSNIARNQWVGRDWEIGWDKDYKFITAVSE